MVKHPDESVKAVASAARIRLLERDLAEAHRNLDDVRALAPKGYYVRQEWDRAVSELNRAIGRARIQLDQAIEEARAL